MQFNILSQPWIPVYQSGKPPLEVNLLDFLRQAHEYKQFDGLSVFEEVGIRRFLATLLMAVYRPKTAGDIQKIAKAGKLDVTRIQAYIRACEEEGVSFDIFDSKRPFLQSPYLAKFDEDKEKSIAELNPVWPSGDMPVHINHQLEKDAVMTPAEAFRYLLSIPAFSISSTAGAGMTRPFGINGVPPWYWFIEGETLFESLVYSMVPVSEEAGELWRSHTTVTPWIQKKNGRKGDAHVEQTSFLYGLLFPCRRIRLLPDADGLVRTCLFQQGLNYKGTDWTDPFVAYSTREIKGETTRLSLKPRLDKPLLQFVPELLMGNLAVLQQWQELYPKEGVRLRALGAVKDGTKAKYLAVQAGTFVLPHDLLQDTALRQWLLAMDVWLGEYMKDFRGALKILLRITKASTAGMRHVEDVVNEFQQQAWQYIKYTVDDPDLDIPAKESLAIMDGICRKLLKRESDLQCETVGEWRTAERAFLFLNTRLKKRRSALCNPNK